jgi:hypothetical protein
MHQHIYSGQARAIPEYTRNRKQFKNLLDDEIFIDSVHYAPNILQICS